MIRAEADFARFTPEEEIVAVRMIHAAGMVDLAPHIRFSPGMAIAARAALESGCAHPLRCPHGQQGITKKRLPANNQIICTLQHPEVPALAARMQNTLRRRRGTLASTTSKARSSPSATRPPPSSTS